MAAANNGQVYNPVLGFTPVRDIAPGNKYVYRPFYGAFAPRVAIAWNPQVNGGWLGKILGDKATVIRAGFGRFYSRSLGIDLVSTPVLGDGFLQPVGCANPNKAGACTGPGQVDPTNAFRVGVDGLNPPVGAITPTLPIPVTPGYNAPYATLGCIARQHLAAGGIEPGGLQHPAAVEGQHDSGSGLRGSVGQPSL